MFKLASTAFAIASLAQAMALPSQSPATTALPQVARFENQPGLPAVGVSPIGIYLDIFWQGMSLTVTGGTSLQVPGLVPNSPPNYAAFGPENAATIMQGTPEMTTVYDDSTVDSFTLHSFFYGCAVNTEESVTSDTDSCNITITGFSSSGKQVAKQTFRFVADGLSQQMVKASPSGFTNVQYIQFAFQAQALAGNAASALIDTVSYDAFSI